MSYQNNLLYAIAAVVAPYFRNSTAFTNFQVPKPPALLETMISTSAAGQDIGRKGHPSMHTPSVRVPFYRGIPPEPKKSPAPSQPHVNGNRTPRCSYRKVAEHK